MKGSIRFGLGMLLVMGSAGGIEVATDPQLIPLILTTIIGLTLMYFGAKALTNS